ncbi:MAG: FAD-dependent oxidoreductase, partial [Solirubrobacteraceae bacterium]
MSVGAPPHGDGPAVTVAGGGMAGLTAALRLAQRGYRVTVYEQRPMLGGDLASRPGLGSKAPDLDVYPHMYCSWYSNLWRLLDEVAGDVRDRRFREFDGYAQLIRGEFPRVTRVRDIYSLRHLLGNLFSGVGPVADMYVFGYASVDLLAETLNPTMSLSDVSVTGFLQSRPYMTERAADAYDSFITRVWGIPSYLTSADDFRQYLKYSLADPTPAFRLPRGPAQREVIEPLTAALERAGVRIVRRVQVTSVTCAGRRVARVGLQRTRRDPRTGTWVGSGQVWSEDVDELVLAVPPVALLSLLRSGESGERVVELAPELTEVSRMRSVQVPIINLFFNRKLRQIPAEPVGLFGSRYTLAFTDISQTWDGIDAFDGHTVLVVSASDTYALPGTGPDDDAYAMLAELAEYLDFDPGPKWGTAPDVDWNRTQFSANTDTQLFVNETGTDVWRPPARSDGVENLTLAGDFCANDVGLTTIESAVTTGLLAARAIVQRRGIGAPVRIDGHGASVLRDALYVGLRYAWAPYAVSAAAWSRSADLAGAARSVLGGLAGLG